MKNSLYNKVSEILSSYNFYYSINFKDLTTNETIFWYNHNPNVDSTSFPSASTIKIFIIIEAYNQINNGIIFRDNTIILEDKMKVGGAGILSSYPNNIEISIDDLLYLMMTESDNTATNILIDILDIDNINNMIKNLSLKNSSLNRKMMDFNAIKNGIDNYTSVLDLSTVLEKLYKNSCINEEYDNLILNIMKNCTNKTKISDKLPTGIEVSHKTGELDGVENDAGIVFTPYGNYILSILTKNGENHDEITAISDISKVIYDCYCLDK